MDAHIIKKLASMRLFAGIDETNILHMLTCIEAVEHHCHEGESIILKEDDPKVGVILSGTAQIVRESPWGDKTFLTTLVQGDLFGKSFACNDVSYGTASFVAMTQCHILSIPFRRPLETCTSHLKLIENCLDIIAQKNVTLMETLDILSKKTIRERILAWLIQQVQVYGSKCFTASIGRIQLAESLCVDRSALTRELSNMKRDGLLDFQRNTYELKVPVNYTNAET